MRHKWKNIKNEYISVNTDQDRIYLHDCQICIKCGLKKGNKKIFGGYGYYLIYFKNSKILSKNKLSFKCIDERFKSMLFTKEEFMI